MLGARLPCTSHLFVNGVYTPKDAAVRKASMAAGGGGGAAGKDDGKSTGDDSSDGGSSAGGSPPASPRSIGAGDVEMQETNGNGHKPEPYLAEPAPAAVGRKSASGRKSRA